MSIWFRTSVLALRPLLPKAARVAAQAAGCSVASEGIDAVEKYLVAHFGDPSRRLPQALSRAADRAWRALEVAVAGESLWSKLARHGEDKAYSAEVRAFLDANPLRLAPSQDAAFRRRVCRQLQEARKEGLVPGQADSPDALAKSAAELARFTDSVALCQAEWQAVAVISTELRGAGHNALADLLELRPDPAEPPLLAVAIRFFFRREVETDEALFRGLVYEQVDHLRQEVYDGLNRLLSTLETQGGRLSELLTVTEEMRDNVLDLKTEQARQGADLQVLYMEVVRQGDKLDRLHERALLASDSLSIRGEPERQLVRQVVGKYRALPEEQRRQLPALLDAIGKLELAAGEYKDAQRHFQQQAAWVDDCQPKAAAHFGAYLAALERREWDTALAELQAAMRLDPERWEPFPSAKFVPERILGAGGFGVVFLCRDADSGARVAVKALRTDELDRDSTTVIAEAEQLEDIEHENIIRLRTAGFADFKKTRPFLVMSYFDGVTLEEHVRKNGALRTIEAREVARQVAAGLMAAHERNILHRDVKPGNVLVRRSAEGPAGDGRWQVKLIDFGLALRRQAVHTTMSNADALVKTMRGQSIAGTLDYAAPEQIGKLAGASVGLYSDVYGFGKTLCFAVFGTPTPGPRHWRTLGDNDFGELLGQCIEEQPQARPQRLTEIISRLQAGTSQAERLRQHKDEEGQPPDQTPPQTTPVSEIAQQPDHIDERDLRMAIRRISADNLSVHEALELVLGDDTEATFPRLLESLAHPNWHVRRAAAVIFRHLGTLALEALSALVETLADPTPEVRQAAMHALEAIDPAWPERNESLPAVSRLVAKLDDGSARCHAVEVLSRFGGRAEQAVPALIQRLSHEHAGVRQAAATALGKIGSPAKSAIPVLVGLLADISNDVRNTTGESLPLISDQWASSVGTQRGVPALIERLSDSNKEAREAAVHALSIIRPGAEDHIRLLTVMLWDSRPHAQIAAASVLAKIGAAAQVAVPALVANLVDPASSVRSAASDALAQIDHEWADSARLSEAVPKLISLLDHESSQIRCDVIRLLGQLRPLTEVAVLLFAAMADPDAKVRQLAQQTLPNYHGIRISRADAEKVVPHLVKLTSVGDAQIRLGALNALGAIGSAAKEGIPAVVSVLADRETCVRKAAWEASIWSGRRVAVP